MRTDPRTAENQKTLWEFSESLLPRKRCGDFNQSLMELGSEICHPRKPKCLLCPIRDLCPTAVQGLQDAIPAATRKMKYEDINEAVIIACRGGKYLVRQCGPGERWEGLWDFPRYPVPDVVRGNGTALDCLAGLMNQHLGLTVELEPSYRTIKHAVTRFRITLDCFKTKNVSGRLKRSSGELQWMTVEEIGQTPMSVTGRKVARELKS